VNEPLWKEQGSGRGQASEEDQFHQISRQARPLLKANGHPLHWGDVSTLLRTKVHEQSGRWQQKEADLGVQEDDRFEARENLDTRLRIRKSLVDHEDRTAATAA